MGRVRRANFDKRPATKNTIPLWIVNLETDPQADANGKAITAYNRFLHVPSVATTSLVAAATANKGCIVHDETTDTIKWSSGSAWADIAGTATTLDACYAASGAGRAITVDAGAVDLNGTHGSNNVLEVANNQGAGTGALIDLAHSNTAAKDIDGTGSAWYVTGLGDMTVNDMVVGGDLTVSGSFTLAGTTFTGEVIIGADGAGHDVTFFSDTAGDYIKFDDATKVLYTADCMLQVQDDDFVLFGNVVGTGDYKMYSDGSDLFIAAVANVATKALKIGDATNELDLIWNSTTMGAEVTFDSSALFVYFDGVDINLGDADILTFGNGASANGDFQIVAADDGSFLIAPVANNSTTQLSIGDVAGTNEMDVAVYFTTATDLVLFDWSADQVIFTNISLNMDEEGTGTTTIDVDSAATSVPVAEITASGVLADDKAVLSLVASGAIADGSNILRIASTGTPASGAIAIELAAAGDDLIAFYGDTDTAGDDAFYLNVGGDPGSGKAVMRLNCDVTTPNAASSILRLEAAKDMYGVYIATAGAVTNDGNLITTSGALAAGKGVLSITATGTPNQGALLRLSSAKNCYGFYVDTDPTTLDANLINTGGILAANKAQLKITADAGDWAAGAHSIYVDATSMTYTNNNDLVHLKGKGTGALLLLTSTDTGALGAHVKTDHNGGAGAASDDVFRLAVWGYDNAGTPAANQYGQIDCTIVASTAGSETGKWDFGLCASGSIVNYMTLSADKLVVGNSNATITTNSTSDLTLNTNNGTNSGSIVIADGVNGDISITPNGTGSSIVDAFAANHVVVTHTAAGALTLTESHSVIACDTTTQATPITLPDASAYPGKEYIIVFETDAGTDVVVTCAAGDTFDATNNQATMNDAADYLHIIAIGSNRWFVIGDTGNVFAAV
jgi:hypothetical protein